MTGACRSNRIWKTRRLEADALGGKIARKEDQTVQCQMICLQIVMGDESSPNNSCPSSPSLPEKMTDSSSSPVAAMTTSDSVKEEGTASSPCSSGSSNKPSAQLSFSIARLINKVPSDSPPAPAVRSDPASLLHQYPPVYPIPMWPPSSNARFPQGSLPGYCEPSLNQMLRTVLMHQTALPTDALATLMRHYQQQFYAHPPAGLFPPPPPPPLNLSATAAVARAAAATNAANMHKVEILRSAASASLQQQRPHHPHGKSPIRPISHYRP